MPERAQAVDVYFFRAVRCTNQDQHHSLETTGHASKIDQTGALVLLASAEAATQMIASLTTVLVRLMLFFGDAASERVTKE